MLESILFVPRIVTVPFGHEAQAHLTSLTDNTCVALFAVLALLSPFGPILGNKEGLVSLVGGRRWVFGPLGRALCANVEHVKDQPFTEGQMVVMRDFVCHALCLIQDKGIHDCYIHSMIEQCAIPDPGLVEYIIILDEGIGVVHAAHELVVGIHCAWNGDFHRLHPAVPVLDLPVAGLTIKGLVES